MQERYGNSALGRQIALSRNLTSLSTMNRPMLAAWAGVRDDIKTAVAGGDLAGIRMNLFTTQPIRPEVALDLLASGKLSFLEALWRQNELVFPGQGVKYQSEWAPPNWNMPDMRHPLSRADRPEEWINAAAAYKLLFPQRSDPRPPIRSAEQLREYAAVNGLGVDFAALRSGLVVLGSQLGVSGLGKRGFLPAESWKRFTADWAHWLAESALEATFHRYKSAQIRHGVWPYPLNIDYWGEDYHPPPPELLPVIGRAYDEFMKRVPEYVRRGGEFPTQAMLSAANQYLNYVRRELTELALVMGADRGRVADIRALPQARLDMADDEQTQATFTQPIIQLSQLLPQDQRKNLRWIAGRCGEEYLELVAVVGRLHSQPEKWSKKEPGSKVPEPTIPTMNELENAIKQAGGGGSRFTRKRRLKTMIGRRR